MPAALAVFLTALPLVYLVVRVAESGPGTALEVLSRPRTATLIANSFGLMLAVTATAVVVGGLQAWLVTRSDLPGRPLWGVLAALPLAIPSYVTAFGWLGTFGEVRGFWPAYGILAAGTSPYVFLAAAAALRRSDGSAEEVARSLGMGPARTALTVTLPSIRAALAAGGLLVALYALSDFGGVSLVRFDTFTRVIHQSYRASFDRDTAAVLALVLVPLTIMVVFAESRFRGRDVGLSSKSRQAVPVHLGRMRIPAISLMVATALVALGLPLFSLVRWTAAGVSRADPSRVLESLANTLWLGFLGGLMCTALAVPVAVLAVRHSGRWPRLVEGTTWLAHALPGIVVALALVFLSNAAVPWLYQTTALVVIAYVILFLPNAMAAVRTPLTQAPVVLDEVARSMGRRPAEVLREVTLPIAGPGILAGAAMVSLAVIKELPATLLLRPTETETLATRLWTETSVGAFSAAAPYAALLVLVGAVPSWLLSRRLADRKEDGRVVAATGAQATSKQEVGP